MVRVIAHDPAIAGTTTIVLAETATETETGNEPVTAIESTYTTREKEVESHKSDSKASTVGRRAA